MLKVKCVSLICLVFSAASVAACLLLQLSLTMTANKAIEILREHRGGGAIQTVKVGVYISELKGGES